VIVPVRKPAPYLEETLASVRGQEQPPDELAVVDDDAGRGPAATRAAALASMQADLIALADADDEARLAQRLMDWARRPRSIECWPGYQDLITPPKYGSAAQSGLHAERRGGPPGRAERGVRGRPALPRGLARALP